MRIGTNLIVSPLHDPMRLAEDAATLSLLSGGRFDLGVGQGYWEREFEAFGKQVRQPSEPARGGRRDHPAGLVGLGGGLRGQALLPAGASRSRRFPSSTPQLLVGAMADVAIERVARIADGFLSTQNAHHETYLAACRAPGRSRSDARIYAGQWSIIAEDPEEVWSRIGKHALYQLNEYISWGAFGPPDDVPRFADPAQIVAAGAYRLMDAETAVTELTDMLRACPQIKDVHFWAQLPGEPVDSGSERIAYLADKVVPAVRERLAG